MTSKTQAHASSSGGNWSILADKVLLPCIASSPYLEVYNSEQEAQIAFRSLKGPRILIDTSGAEVMAAPGAWWKKGALRMIRQELQRNAWLQLSAPKQTVDRDATWPSDMADMAELDFSEDKEFLSDAFSDLTQVVELPRKKRLRSDSVSTDVDLENESSQTTRSAFTISQVCQSTSSSVYRLLDLGSKNGSVDICQSTSSSVHLF
jgi:hypothetical protein